MSLDTYRRRRDFRLTPEPVGREVTSDPWSLAFAVHLRGGWPRSRFELRLEHDGVLLSWTLPHGPSLDPADPRSALRIEDHPVAYRAFEGAIPVSACGGGPVMMWDRGRWRPESDPAHGLAVGRLAFALEGDRLHGSWRLLRTGQTEWALTKRPDEHARPGDGDHAVRTYATSVSSGRTLDAIEAEGCGDADPVRPFDADPLLGEPGAVRGEVPWPLCPVGPQYDAADPRNPRLSPSMLGEVGDLGGGEPDEPTLWGFRLLARKADGRIVLATRSGIDCTSRYPRVAEALAAVPLPAFLVDGEVAPTNDRLRAVDLLSAGSADLRGVPWPRRRELLQELFGSGTAPGARMPAFPPDPAHADAVRPRAPRGRGREDFLVVGFTARVGSTLSSLLVGQPIDGAVRYRGRVGTGFTARERAALRSQLDPLVVEVPAIAGAPPVPTRDRVRWLQPKVRIEVSYAAQTARGLRHASFLGLR